MLQRDMDLDFESQSQFVSIAFGDSPLASARMMRRMSRFSARENDKDFTPPQVIFDTIHFHRSIQPLVKRFDSLLALCFAFAIHVKPFSGKHWVKFLNSSCGSISHRHSREPRAKVSRNISELSDQKMCGAEYFWPGPQLNITEG